LIALTCPAYTDRINACAGLAAGNQQCDVVRERLGREMIVLVDVRVAVLHADLPQQPTVLEELAQALGDALVILRAPLRRASRFEPEIAQVRERPIFGTLRPGASAELVGLERCLIGRVPSMPEGSLRDSCNRDRRAVPTRSCSRRRRTRS